MNQPAYLPLETTLPQELGFRDYLAILRRRRATVLAVFFPVLALGVFLILRAHSVYQTATTLLVPARSTGSSTGDAGPFAPLLAATQPDSLDTQLRVLQSDSLMEEAARAAHLYFRPGVVPPSVTALADTSNDESARADSHLIQVVVEGGNPRDIAALANALAAVYLQHLVQSARSGIKETLQFVRTEKDRAGARLSAGERRLLRCEQAHGGAAVSTERDARSGEYTALVERVLESKSNVIATRAQIVNLRSRLAEEPLELSQTQSRENPRIAKLRDRLDELRFQRVDLLRDYKPTSRQVRDMDSEIDRLSAELAAEPPEIRSQMHLPNPARASMQSQLESLETALPGQEENYNTALAQLKVKKSMLDSLGPWESEINRLSRERDLAQGAYKNLSDRLQDLEIRSRAQVSTARVLDAASIPDRPVRPQKSLQILIATCLALCLAGGAALLQETLSERISSPHEVGQIVGLPALGAVPELPPHESPLVHLLPINSVLVEAYRSLRASVGFAGVDAPIRRLLIASPSSGEGRSTTALNLATAMARDGKLVILVDADLRSPRIHSLLDAPCAPGLGEVLAGFCSVDDAMYATRTESLLFIPAGSPVTNPTEMLGSRAFEQLLSELEERADIIILDSPPCLSVADAVTTAGRVDAVLLVVRLGKTRKTAVKQAVALLARARTRILGTLLNQARGNISESYYSLPYQHPVVDPGPALRERSYPRNGSRPPEDRAHPETSLAASGRSDEHES